MFCCIPDIVPGIANVNIDKTTHSRPINGIGVVTIYSNAAATMTIIPALPAYIAFKLAAAPMKFSGTTAVDVALADEGDFKGVLSDDVGVVRVEEPLKVDVTSATTSETVIVRVRVAVEVRVVVSSARARRGRRA